MSADHVFLVGLHPNGRLVVDVGAVVKPDEAVRGGTVLEHEFLLSVHLREDIDCTSLVAGLITEVVALFVLTVEIVHLGKIGKGRRARSRDEHGVQEIEGARVGGGIHFEVVRIADDLRGGVGEISVISGDAWADVGDLDLAEVSNSTLKQALIVSALLEQDLHHEGVGLGVSKGLRLIDRAIT